MGKKYLINQFDEILESRRSIRLFDESVKIERKEMISILEDATQAPSSLNMQPWRFVVVESEEGKDILRPLIKFNEQQNDTSSAMIAIFGDLNSIENADKILTESARKGYISQDRKDIRLKRYTEYFENKSQDRNIETILMDGALVAMNLMTVARAYGYDTNAIGGFERDKLARELGLDEDRYYPVMIIAIGKKAEEKVGSYRLPVEDITSWK